MTKCSVSDCKKPTRTAAADLCHMHYMRLRRHGDVNVVKIPPQRPIGYRFVRSDGYVLVKVGPGRTEYELEHRLVAQRMLGRPLVKGRRGEHVHHINGDKADNRPGNLVVMTNAEHQRHHDWDRTKPRRVGKICERCGNQYEVKVSKVPESRFCSNACRLVALHQGNRKN